MKIDIEFRPIGTKRDWKLMHRYIFHHIFMSDGMKAVIGVVCQPHTCSRSGTLFGLMAPLLSQNTCSSPMFTPIQDSKIYLSLPYTHQIWFNLEKICLSNGLADLATQLSLHPLVIVWPSHASYLESLTNQKYVSTYLLDSIYNKAFELVNYMHY